MKLKTLSALILLVLAISLNANNDKIIFGKKYNKIQTKTHPASDFFAKQYQQYVPNKKSPNFNKLLVLLVDFQLDDNPNTTGNGKFVSTIDTTYKFIIDSPPRNKLFYETHMEALKYYYKAASFESFQLEYDVYPKNAGAYTLPHEMAYYHPVNASNDLFISRVEEYFHDVFTTADQDSSLYFGNYDHYMIIHAGSDWQHDINGDSPSDLPSFFIRVGTGKEVVVDNGATTISHACNVPETITQDTYETVEDGTTYIYGYGAVNAVYAHEFGHSLGLVDLYNTTNSRPMVGVFDIMDSGGQGLITIPDPLVSDKYYAIEGALPALPGAWSRNLAFGNYFNEKGITRSLETDLFDLSQVLKVRAAESKYSADNTPHFYKIPLNEKEYLLIENKSIDPDEDGGTTIKSALNGRIALHPCPYISDEPTYEYDWLMPSWMDRLGNWYGGGLLIWHIDNERIYETGVTDSNGDFISNFENNSVNPLFAKRGVRVIEADNIQDLGNPSSWFWTGTAYDFFFKNAPVLDEYGLFVRWSGEIHNDSLSAFTKPALYTNKGNPSSWAIHSISKAMPVMSFRLANALFDNTIRLHTADNMTTISPATNFIPDTATDLMISANDESKFWSHNYNNHEDNWNEFWSIDQAFTPTLPIQKVRLKANNLETLLIVEGNKVNLVSQDIYQTTEFDQQIKNAPIIHYQGTNILILIPFEDKTVLYKLDQSYSSYVFSPQNSVDFTGKIIANNQQIALLSERSLSFFDWNLELQKQLPLDEVHSHYEPVALQKDDGNIELFIMSDNGKIHRVNNQSNPLLIMDTKHFTASQPSQIALVINQQNQLNISFAAKDKAFLIFNDGTLVDKFPLKLNNFTIADYSYPTIIKTNNAFTTIFNSDNGGFIGIKHNAEIDYNNTAFWQHSNIQPSWFKEQATNRLYLIYTDNSNNIFLSYRHLGNNDDLLWNGFRNGENGYITGNTAIISTTSPLNAFIYPNPVMNANCRLRIENAKANIQIKIYNISGNLVQQSIIEKGNNTYQDYHLDTSKLASGVYYALITTDKEHKRVKFAVIK